MKTDPLRLALNLPTDGFEGQESLNELNSDSNPVSADDAKPESQDSSQESVQNDKSTQSVEAIQEDKTKRSRERKHPTLKKTQTRIDVRCKKVLRSIISILKSEFEDRLQSAQSCEDKAFKLLDELEEYRGLVETHEGFVKLYFIVASKTLKTKFKDTMLK